MEDILVSIVCITYNHEAFIKDALEGFLHQNVDFKYEVIVHDDASTDKTSQIIKEYEEKYPEIFQCFYENENQFSIDNGIKMFANMLKMCQGRYIALCEGDDFWIDSHKLKIQIDWMENHPEYFMTAHNALRIDYKDYTLATINPYISNKEISQEELIMRYNGNLPTASMIMRDDIKNMESFFLECGVGDIPIQLYSMAKGKIYYFDRIMSIYRYNHNGSWCANILGSDSEKVILHYAGMTRFAYKYDSYTEKKYCRLIHDLVLNYLFAIFNRCSHLSIFSFKQKIQFLIDNSEEDLQEYLCNIEEAYEQFFSENYVASKLKSFINSHRHVYIWGTGHYGTILAQKFKYNGIDYEGFIVSDDFVAKEVYIEKPVYKLFEMCDRTEDMCIIVAVDRTLWKELRNKLENNKITEYCYMICI